MALKRKVHSINSAFELSCN